MRGWMRTMTAAVVVMGVVSAQASWWGAQVKDELFAGAEKFAVHAKESNEVNLDKKLLGMASHMMGGKDKDEASTLIKSLDYVIVRSYEYANKGEYNMADVDEFRKRLDADGWSHVVKERSATESTDICLKTDKEDQISELVVIDAEPKELTFIHLKGHLSMDQLMKAGAGFGVPQGSAAVGGGLKKR